MKINIKRIFWLSLVFLSFFSCKDKVPEFSVCGCTASSVERISEEGAIVALSRDGYKLISVKYGYLTPCADLPLEFQVDGQLVLFSGSLIKTCYKDHSGTGLRSLKVEIAAINSRSALYQSGNLTLTIINTADYGKEPGFGYIVNDLKKEFKIIQTQIPGSNSVKTFKTAQDALKIAFVVAYRLENVNDFPSIYLGDLYFLKIIDVG